MLRDDAFAFFQVASAQWDRFWCFCALAEQMKAPIAAGAGVLVAVILAMVAVVMVRRRCGARAGTQPELGKLGSRRGTRAHSIMSRRVRSSSPQTRHAEGRRFSRPTTHNSSRGRGFFIAGFAALQVAPLQSTLMVASLPPSS